MTGAVDLVKFCGIFSDMLRAQAGAQAGADLYITGKLLELLSELYYVYQTYGEAPVSLPRTALISAMLSNS